MRLFLLLVSLAAANKKKATSFSSVRKEALVSLTKSKLFIIVARADDASLFESMAAVVSGYAVALVTGRSLVVSSRRLKKLFDLSAFEGVISKAEVARCLDSTRSSPEGVVDDWTAEDIYSGKAVLREPAACLRPLRKPVTWVASCHKKFVFDGFAEDPRIAHAQIENKALKLKKRRRLFRKSMSDDDRVAANYYSNSEVKVEKNATIDERIFAALASSRTAWRRGWSAFENRDLSMFPNWVCPVWPKDPVDLELKRSLGVEREAFGTLRFPEKPDHAAYVAPWHPDSMIDDEGSRLARLYLRQVLWRRKDTILIYEGRIYADRHLLENDKARKHMNFMASLGKRVPLPNIAYLIQLRSTGQSHGGYFGPPSNHNETTWNARIWPDIRKQEHRNLKVDQNEEDLDEVNFRLPSLSIAKSDGYEQASILMPNMYFGDLSDWQKETDLLMNGAATRNFENRLKKVFWRGAIRHNVESDCDVDVGNYARLSAVSLSKAEPGIFDVRCVDAKESLCHLLTKKNLTLPCYHEKIYDDDMRAALKDPAAIVGTYVHREDFSKYQFLLNLPGSLRGSYSRNLNHLWLLDSVVLLWNETGVNAGVREWYYPGLQDGKTHLNLDKQSAKAKLQSLLQDTTMTSKLRKEGRKVHDDYLSPDALARYFLRTFQLLRSTFDLAPILDYPKHFDRELKAALDCSQLEVLEFVDVEHLPKTNNNIPQHKTNKKHNSDRRLTTRLRTIKRSCDDILHPPPLAPTDEANMEIIENSRRIRRR